MAKPVELWVGTRKGAFVFRSADRRKWAAEGPFLPGGEINCVVQDPRDPKRVYAAVNSAWFGPHLHVSTNGGKTWKLSEKGLELKSVEGESLKRIWKIQPGHADEPKVVYLGGDPGALFRSEDYGKSWSEVTSLNQHATRKRWNPGAGGMCLHSIEPLGGGRLVVAISAAGAFRSSDDGANWEPYNQGVRTDFQPEKFPEVGQCVHKLRAHPANPNLLFQQNHCGIYRGAFDGKKWKDISKGLPSRFGFAAAVPASEPETMFTVPIQSPEYRCNLDGALAVGRTRDGGKTWELLRKGLPQENTHLSILREAMDADAHKPAGVYFGTAGGQVYYSRNGGDSWQALAEHLPPVYSVSASVAA
ncbi:MAG: exo-alpha-sialidase [Acidobacteria bacterium]|nr:exo-alpha-sialidase [Acidobacteriota bacterium]